MNKEKILNMLGLALRASSLVTGEEGVIDAMQKGKVKAVYLASDASDATRDTFDKKCFFYNIPLFTIFTSDELSHAIGKKRKVIGITNQGMFNSIKKYMED